MDIWKILEIEKCKDKEKITTAYREKLQITNPEDSPEEFKRLRAAYEQALAYADEQQVEEEDTSPLGIWMKKVKEIYASITKRCDETCWKALLEDDICIALDTKSEARDALLKFLMNSFRLPMNIWILLNDVFELEEQREELCEMFPEDFINFIFREMKESTLLPLELFQGPECADYDQYISLLNQSMRAINSREMDEAQRIIDEMKHSGIYHPYQTIDEIRVHLIKEAFKEARFLAEDLYMIYPEDPEVVLYMGETSNYLGNYEEALKYYDEHLEKMPKSFLGRYGKADCFSKQKKYKDSKELLIQMLDDFPYNNAIQHRLRENNELMIAEFLENIEDDSVDTEQKLEFGWSCLQNHKIEEGIKILAVIVPDKVQEFSYRNLSGRLYMESGDCEKAIENFAKWEEMIRALPDEVEEEYKKDKNRLHLPIYLQALALNKMGKKEESFQKNEESLAIKRDEEALNLKAHLLYEKECYEEAIEVCNEMEKINANHIGVYAYRGKSLYSLGYYQAAYNDFEKWLNIYAYDLEPYVYKMRIFINYEQYDRAKQIADYLTSQNVKADSLNDCIAQIMEYTGGKEEKSKAYEMYQDILVNYENNCSDVRDIHRIIYRMAILDENDYPAEMIVKKIERGLSYKKDYIPLLDYKAFLLKKLKKNDEAVEVYQDILKYNPGNTRANMRIGDIFFDRKEYRKALEYYLKQRDNEYSQTALIDIGRAQIELGMLDEAKETCLDALKMDPETSCLYHNIGLICNYQKKYDEAIEYFECALEKYQKNGDTFAKTYDQLASAYIRSGKAEQALKTYRDAYEQTKNSRFYLELSDGYRFYGRYDEAMGVMEQYLQIAENDNRQEVYDEKKAVLMILSGDMKKAYKFMKKSKCTFRDMQQALVDYYILKKDYKKASSIFADWIEKNPNDLECYRFISLRSTWMGNISYAREVAAKGLDVLKNKKKNLNDQIVGYKNAAVFHAVLGNYKDAFYCVQKAHESCLCAACKYNICKDVECVLAMIYDIMGDRKRALDILYKCATYCKDDIEVSFLIERLRR